MSDSGSKLLPCLGFLTICDYGEGGFCGGYLVLNAAGRPLEFHCTAPVKANRAQEILYGPTLRPFLFGEQIGQTLLSRAKAGPQLVVTDIAEALAVRPFSKSPVVCLVTADDESAEGAPVFRLGDWLVMVERTSAGDRAAVEALWQQHFERVDLQEPFGRIREALEESRKAA